MVKDIHVQGLGVRDKAMKIHDVFITRDYYCEPPVDLSQLECVITKAATDKQVTYVDLKKMPKNIEVLRIYRGK